MAFFFPFLGLPDHFGGVWVLVFVVLPPPVGYVLGQNRLENSFFFARKGVEIFRQCERMAGAISANLDVLDDLGKFSGDFKMVILGKYPGRMGLV